MSVMRLTMIVHSESGDEQGQQDCVMQTVELPDDMDRETGFALLGGLAGHVEDELRYIREQNADADAVAESEGQRPRESTKGDGWPT